MVMHLLNPSQPLTSCIGVATTVVDGCGTNDTTDHFPRGPRPTIVVERKGEEPRDTDPTLVAGDALFFGRPLRVIGLGLVGVLGLFLQPGVAKIGLAIGTSLHVPTVHLGMFAGWSGVGAVGWVVV